MVIAHDHQRTHLQHFSLVENCLIAELHRLHALLPSQFFDADATSVYARILVDFGHFNDPSRLEALIARDDVR